MKTLIPFFKLLIRIEFRDKSKIFALFFYSILISFLFGLFFKKISPQIWNINFWILFLFNALNVSYNLFHSVSRKEIRFLKNTVSPNIYFLGMFLALFLFSFVNNLILLWVFSLFGGMENLSGEYLFLIFLVSFSLSANLALIAFIGQKAEANTGLLTILSLPTTLPLLAKAVFYGQTVIINPENNNTSDIVFILAIGIFLFVLSLFLFPLLWKD